MPAGRPSEYTPQTAAKICAGIAIAQSLAEICSAEGMPARQTVYEWLRAHSDFADMYARAREDQADYLASQLIEIADNSKLDHNDRRVRLDARKWVASKLKPRSYGERLHTEHSGTVRTTDMSDDELDRLITERMQAVERAQRD